MRTLLFSISLFFVLSSINSQSLLSDYHHQYEGFLSTIDTLHEDGQGNIILIGRTTNAVNLDQLSMSYITPTTNEQDPFIAKYNSNHEFLWAINLEADSLDTKISYIDIDYELQSLSYRSSEKKTSYLNKEFRTFLESYKKLNLRYISAGWTRIHPDYNIYETPSTMLTENRSNEAHLCLYFGDQLDSILLIKCKCLDYKESTVYRFGFEEIENKDQIKNGSVSIATGDLYLKSIQFYEPPNLIYSIEPGREKEEIENDNYFSNGILIEFTNGKFLSLYGTEGDDQHESTIYFNFVKQDEIEIHRIDNMKNWKLEYEI